MPGGPSLPSAPADETGVVPGCWEGREKQKRNFFFVASDLSPFHPSLKTLALIPAAVDLPACAI